jgi:hypothetical protein
VGLQTDRNRSCDLLQMYEFKYLTQYCLQFLYIGYMKKYFLLVALWISLPTFGQEVVRVNFNDSCVMRDGKISKTDFLKLVKICHPQLKEVKSFIMIVVISGQENSRYYSSNRWDPKTFKTVPVGTKVYFENIKGIAPQGQFTKGSDIKITIN